MDLLALALLSGWRTDPAWDDGKAEVCVYEATRTIYAQERRYLATAYTDKERADPASTVKVEDGGGIEVFKHHVSEVVPTENYDYRFSTMVYLRTEDLSPLKLSASTQDGCGASFKEIWRDGDRLRFWESVYFPGAGRREGRCELRRDTQLADALTLSLRDYPFDAPRDVALRTVPSQKDVHRVPFDPVERTVRYGGREELELPIGRVAAHRLELVAPDGAVAARYWFAADGSAPRLHALVRYEGEPGVSYRLKSHERSAYWKR